MLHQYSIMTGQTVPTSEFWPQAAVLLSLMCVVMELACYIYFFSYLNRHDKELLSRKILSNGEFKRRRQVNAITFSGQFYGFIAECVLYFGLMYTLQESSDVVYRVSIVIGLVVEFGIVSVIEIVTSNNLNNFLPHNYFFK